MNYFKIIKGISFVFILYSTISFSQVETSKRKIELLPPVSSALKNIQISPKNPNYFSLTKKS